jgi:N-acetylglucosaminyldiphosphoundecaprenol N-acetyl-beta-D-mannosaminyltransferase
MSSFKVLGVRVDAVQIPDVIALLEEWIRARGRTRYVAVTGMHGVTEAQHSPEMKAILNAADLVVPDGMPLVWVGRVRGFPLKRRVNGPELMLTFCERTEGRGYRHFFYGGADGVADLLAETLKKKFPKLVVAGTYAPPFRSLTPREEEDVIRRVREAAPDVLWVGLSTPKQERWMHRFRDRLDVPVMLGVGAAFDMHTGRVARAPVWMQEHGLEWLFRLSVEPRRLWRRYLVYGSEFVWSVAQELAGLRRFE